MSNASEKAWDKCRIMHRRMKREEETQQDTSGLAPCFLLYSPSFSSGSLRALCGSLFRLAGIRFHPAELDSSTTTFSYQEVY